MAHVHGAKEMAKAAGKGSEMAGMMEGAKGGMEKMMGGMGMMEGGGKGGMGMGDRMGMMMEGGAMEGMKTGMEMMGSHHMMPNMPAMAATGTTAAALSGASTQGRGLVSRIVGNPWVIFGLGVAVGYLVHKYRKEIIATAMGVSGRGVNCMGRDSLEDLVAEEGEGMEQAGKPHSSD